VRTLLIVICCLAAATPVCGQTNRWRLAIEAGEIRFGGSSVDTSSDSSGAFRPFRPATLGLRIERGLDRLGVGIGVMYGEADPALVGRDATVIGYGGALRLLELAPAVSWRLTLLGAGGLYLGGGPVIDRWSWSEGPTRWRVGGELSATVSAPLGGAAALVARAGVGRTASIFEAADLPEEFELRPSWRRSIALGVTLSR
jgi:hypothetical protein